MTLLTAVLSHLPADEVVESFAFIDAVAPGAELVLCYGGPADEFEQIDLDRKLLIDDPTLRGHPQHLQSLTMTFDAVWSAYVRGDDRFDALYLIEYDHLILDPDFEAHLRALADRTGADVMGKNCADRTATNEAHYVRFRRDPQLMAHLQAHSVREDTQRLFGCLGDGIWLSRRALEAYVSLADHPPCYVEVYVPTLLHHLGYTVVDIDAHSELYQDVRWLPVFDAAEATAACARGSAFMHPVKDPSAVRAVRALVDARAGSPTP